MGTLGPQSGTVWADDATLGVVALSNANNAAVDDSSSVTWVLLLGQGGHYLKGTGWNFLIPSDATVTGISIAVTRSSSLTGVVDLSVKAVKGGTVQGDEMGSASTWTAAGETITYGDAGALWGAAWAPADINDPTFGISLSPHANLAATASIDYVSMTVAYLGSNRPGACGSRLSTGALSCVERAA